MGNPVAKQGDQVVAPDDMHIIMVPSPAGPVPTPMPLPFCGNLADALSPDTIVDEQPAALEGSIANNLPHIPPGGPFQTPPSDKATLSGGSATVLCNGKKLARAGDPATTCDDLNPQNNNGVVIATGTVFAGD